MLLCQTEGFIEQHTILYQKFKIDTKNKRKGLSNVILEALSFFIKATERKGAQEIQIMTRNPDRVIASLCEAIKWNRSKIHKPV